MQFILHFHFRDGLPKFVTEILELLMESLSPQFLNRTMKVYINATWTAQAGHHRSLCVQK